VLKELARNGHAPDHLDLIRRLLGL
jgi:hypothetical protein